MDSEVSNDKGPLQNILEKLHQILVNSENCDATSEAKLLQRCLQVNEETLDNLSLSDYKEYNAMVIRKR
jgi:hypothetical protein